jgi:hypothetical protein
MPGHYINIPYINIPYVNIPYVNIPYVNIPCINIPYVILPNITIPKLLKIPNKYTNPERNNPETFYVKIPKSLSPIPQLS